MKKCDKIYINIGEIVMNENKMWIKSALNWLLKENTINKEQYIEFTKYYDNYSDFNIVQQELQRMYQKDFNFINQKYSEIIKKNEFDIEIIDVNEDKIKLENVSDFTNDNKNYMKLNYNDGNVRIIENTFGQKAKETFEYVKSKSSEKNLDETEIFENMLNKSKELSLYDFKNLDNRNIYNELNFEQKQEVNLIMSNEKYYGKRIKSCPKEHLYVVIDNNNEDILLSVESKNGIFQIRQIKENEYVKQDNTNYEIETNESNPPYEEYEKEEKEPLQEKAKQKTLGLHPFYKKAGFTNILFYVFLTGISCGIVLMIILNLLIK